MTVGERIKEVRKSLGLTLDEFGKRVGVTKQTVSRIENGVNNVTDQMVLSICREFNVNEDWLRTGESDFIFLEDDEVLVQYMADIVTGNDELIKDIIKVYMELDQKDRESLNKFVDELFEAKKKKGE